MQTTIGWQANFYLMATIGAGALAMITILLPETTKPPKRPDAPIPSLIRAYGTFMRHRRFLIYMGIVATSYGGLFAWISGSSFALQDLYGLSPLAFGLIFAATTLGYLAGTLFAARWVTRLGIERTIVWGGVALAVGGLAMVITTALELRSPFALALPIVIYLAGLGLALPQSLAGALTPFPDRAGAASSALGFVQQVLGSLLGILVGHSLSRSALPLAAIIAVMGVLALALALFNCTALARDRAG